ncbi:MAG TPA: type VI secretion system baseplate subunit TssG [Steroidobacteraceae bacterium]|nr:type VI secretion system baseplate subunit TssG [Steroidobacteraceae bacterium]
MAGTAGQPTDPVAALATLAEKPSRFSLFAALRLLEQSYAAQPRLGEARKVSDEPVRLAQPPYLIFAPSEVESFRSDGQRPVLQQYTFGMFGPNGALPLHLTEYARERERQLDDPTVKDFVNVLQHRLGTLFHRAWANGDPASNFDRPDQDRFRTYVGALIGIAGEPARGRDDVIDYAKLRRCGRYAPQSRSAEGLESILGDYFELPMRIKQFVGAWLDVPADAFCRLGHAADYATLGAGATLGASSWQCQHKFEIEVGPLSLDSFVDFLPGSRGLRELRALVQMYTNDEWSWQLRLLLTDVAVPGMTLGQAGKLGWTTWLGSKHAQADEVVLQGDERWLA